MSRGRALGRASAVLAVALLFCGGVAVVRPERASADDPSTTTVDTTPVATVTTVAPATTKTPTPRPDAAPRPAPRHARHSVTHVTTSHSSPAPVTPRPAVVRPTVHVSQPPVATHASAPRPHPHPAAAVHRKKPRPHPVAKTPVSPPAAKPVTVAPSTPASSKLRGLWVIAAAGLLLALALVAALLGLRRRPTLQSQNEATAAGLEQVCAITWWHGYLRSQFIACTRDAYGAATVIAGSPFFRWRKKSPPPQQGAAAKALAELLSTLDRLGWQADGGGAHWFEQRFRRVAGSVPAAQPEPAVEPRRRGGRAPVTAPEPR